jgi:hypothetical protein
MPVHLTPKHILSLVAMECMVRACSENGRRKITQNSIEMDAETKDSTRKTKKKAMNERNLNEGQWEDRKQWSLGVGQRRKTF